VREYFAGRADGFTHTKICEIIGNIGDRYFTAKGDGCKQMAKHRAFLIDHLYAKSRGRTFPRFCGLDLTVARRSACHKRIQHLLRSRRNAFDRKIESLFVRFRRFVHSRKLADELQRRSRNFVRRCGRIEIKQHFDISAHTPLI
jgi:hypothetical protein